MRHKVLLYYFLLFSILLFGQTNNNASEFDSISTLIKLSKDNNFSFEKRLDFAKLSSKLSKEIDIDTIILRSNQNLASIYYIIDKYELFKEYNVLNLKLANKLNDSSAIVLANHSIADYFNIKSQNDSAFYYYSKTIKLYEELNNIEKKALILLNIADIQETEKDYIGSEENAINAIKLIQKLQSSERNLDRLWILNNLIAAISSKLKKYDKSIEYHNKAIAISKKMNNGNFNELLSIHNIAFVYRKKKNFKKALELYEELIDRRGEYEEIDPTFYPLIIDNIAYTKLLAGHTDYDNMSTSFYKAYKMSDSLEDDITKLAVTIDLSKFYLHLKDKDSVLKYANRAYHLSKRMSSNDILLESMMILSKIKDGEEGKRYLNEHIKLSDSLLVVERNVRNKFARIELETDELEAENERIELQKIWLSIVSGVLLLTLFLLYIIITQRAKNKELKFVQDQQKANEEIYNLMLSQQDKVDEARANEQKRISQEMHDGVLGRLFGTRLSLDSLNFSEGKDAILKRANYINELQTIEQDIRKISHDLNTDFVSGSGFTDILAELIEKQTQAYKLSYDFNYTDDINWENISNKTKINIYRITQESLQNIYKHAKASHVKISISLKNNVIWVSISDDGVGFDMNKGKKGIGLKNINSRIKELNGNVTFNSKIGEGTTVEISLPYQN